MNQLQDRRSHPIFIHSELDDLGLTPNAFRIYGHLARRAGMNTAWPSYQSMGDVCFSSISSSASWRRRLAMDAVKELVRLRLIAKETRQDNGSYQSNIYFLTDQNAWVVRQDVLGVVSQDVLGVVSQDVPKGTPYKDYDDDDSASPPKKERNFSDEELKAVRKAWQDNMRGMFTPIIDEQLEDLLIDYGSDEVIRGIAVCVMHEGRTMAYLSKVLANKAAGKDKPDTKPRSGGGRAGDKDSDPDTQRANAMYGPRQAVAIVYPDLPEEPNF